MTEIQVYRQKPCDFSPSVSIAASYCECEGKVLFLQRAPGKSQEHTWGLPGGKVEHGESPKEAVIREMKEETSIEAAAEQLRYVGDLFVRYHDLDFVYHMFHHVFSVFPAVSLSDEHNNYAWIELSLTDHLLLIAGEKVALQHFSVLLDSPSIIRKEFYFVRHAEAGCGGDVFSEMVLTEKGRWQAREAQEDIDKLPIQTVYCSPALRAKETAAILIENRPDLFSVELEEIGECTNEVWSQMLAVERGADHQITPALEGFLQQAAKGLNKSLEKDGIPLIVAHGGTFWAFCYHLQVEEPWRLRNCQIIHFSPDGVKGWKK